MTTIAVSSFSLFRVLGPLRFETRDEQGAVQEVSVPVPQEHTIEEFIALAKERLGVDAVELCQIQLDSTDDARIASLRAALDDNGIRLLTVPIDAGDLAGATPEHRAEDVERIAKWIDIAARLGATYVRVNTGTPGRADSADDRAGLVEALVELADHASSRGLRLLIENHGGLSSDPDYLLSVRDAVGHDRLGILLDLGNFEPLVSVSHARFAGETPDDAGLDTEPVYQKIARLAPEATLVHAKAFDLAADGSPLLDLDRALEILSASGYDGPISIEWEGLHGDPWVQTASVLKTVRNHLAKRVRGSAFQG